MKNKNRRKIWFIIFTSLLAISLIMFSYVWIQGNRIETQIEEANQISQSKAPLSQQEFQIQRLELQVRRLKSYRNISISIFFVVVFGLLTLVTFIRWRIQPKAMDPEALIEKIGSEP